MPPAAACSRGTTDHGPRTTDHGPGPASTTTNQTKTKPNRPLRSSTANLNLMLSSLCIT
ncbi:hypothetical protein JYU34_007843 [Plutella xylostella]|uniref:Uncharacterized protein n=1 Tax=Plutella xylostella TaxID=51655 RepID=A0ABQ7QRG7_PLUXY|nr:hypothetical protein JYU34_007843 [Plutella xylostella]